MCGSTLPQCLQLWVSVMVVARLQGEVVAPSKLQAIAGLPFTLGCNLTMATGQSLKQVRWLDTHEQTILSYLADQPQRVLTSQDRVELAADRRHSSAITIKRVVPQDEGCYHCEFDIYPTGMQDGRTCLSVTAKVDLAGNKTAVSGTAASLSCRYGLAERVQQVLWRKTAEQGDTVTVASYAKLHRPVVEEPFLGHVTLSRSLGDTRLSIEPVLTEDEGCYTCEFHTYPEGTKSATACLTVYVLPKPQVSHITVSPGVIEANCTAVSRPASEIVWSVEGHNQTLGPAVTSSFQQGDGTTVVTSSLLLQARLLDDGPIQCLVHHRGLEKAMSASLFKTGNSHTIIIITVTVVSVVLLLCLCICLKRSYCS